MHFQKLWDFCAQNKTSEISQNALSEFLELLCAEQHVGNIKNCTFRNYGTPVRSTKRRKSQQMQFQKVGDSCAQNQTSEISKHALSECMGLLCADQNIGHLKHALSEILGLRFAEQTVGNIKTCTFRNSGTPARITKRRESQQKYTFRNSGTLVRTTTCRKS